MIANTVVLFLGVYYWIVHSVYRIMILYSLFSMILLWLTNHHQQGILPSDRIAFESVARWCGISAAVLSAFLIFTTLESLYKRPAEMSVLMAAILVLLIVVLMADTRVNATFFEHPAFLLAMLTFVVLYASFSAYLIQPDLMRGPAYATVDAYRDYANAMRILSLSRIEPDKMILATYYRAFPVVPLEISVMALITSLPSNIGHLIIGAVFGLLGVSSLVLLSRTIIGKRRHALFPVVTLLPALVVLLQPGLIDPVLVVLTPLNFSAAFLSLVFYLALRSVNSDSGGARSSFVSILLVMLVMVPMHVSSTAMAIVLFSAMALFFVRMRSIFRGLAVISLACFALYLMSLTGAPLGDILNYLNQEYLAITEILKSGPSFLDELAARSIGGTADEVSKFLISVPQAFVLAIASVMIVRLTEDKKGDLKRGFTRWSVETRTVWRSLSSFCLFCGLFFVLAFAGSYVAMAWGGLVTRYVVVVLTPLALLMTTVILVSILKNMNTARRLLLLGLLAFYVISVTMSPVFLQESSPIYARLIPIQSERAAASFLAAKFEPDNSSVTQIVADFPFFLHVQGVLLSEHFYEDHVYIPDVISEPIVTGMRTIILSRQYFIQNPYLKGESPYEMPLADPQKWNSFNKIFDDSSTSIYMGTT
jgi:hypothetical protein